MVWRPCDGQAGLVRGVVISGLFSYKVDIITHLRHQREETLGFVPSPRQDLAREMTGETRWSHFNVAIEGDADFYTLWSNSWFLAGVRGGSGL